MSSNLPRIVWISALGCEHSILIEILRYSCSNGLLWYVQKAKCGKLESLRGYFCSSCLMRYVSYLMRSVMAAMCAVSVHVCAITTVWALKGVFGPACGKSLKIASLHSANHLKIYVDPRLQAPFRRASEL